jgi:hypothetical protein
MLCEYNKMNKVSKKKLKLLNKGLFPINLISKINIVINNNNYQNSFFQTSILNITFSPLLVITIK